MRKARLVRLSIRVGLLAVAASVLAVGSALGVSGGDTIATVAGTGTAGSSGDGGPATSAQLDLPYGVTVDAQGNLYIADQYNNRIRKVSGGIIQTVAGNGTAGFSGDGGPATSAQLNAPTGVTVDTQGNLYIADQENQRVRKVSGGIITTVAGTGTAGFAGDGGPATSAQLNYPEDVAVDAQGNLYIADRLNDRIRKVSGGIITTVAGTGTADYSGDGGQATSAHLHRPTGVAVDAQGNLYIADLLNGRIREVSGGIISTVAGGGTSVGLGDGGPATSAQLNEPTRVAVDAQGNLYIADTQNQLIREVSGGIITTVAGTGTAGYSGDGGPATSAKLHHPTDVAVDAQGNLYVADQESQRVRTIENKLPPPPPPTPPPPPPPTPPPPPAAPKLKAGKPTVGKAVAGKAFTVSLTVKNAKTGKGVNGQVSCTGKLAGKSLPASHHASSADGKASCSWQLPKTAHGTRFTGSIGESYNGVKISDSFSVTVV